MNSWFIPITVAAAIGLSAPSALSADVEHSMPFAATGFVDGSYEWRNPSDNLCTDCDYELHSIVAGGDFVIPIGPYWNIQLGGAWDVDTLIDLYTNTQFQASAVAFWRDPSIGLFGLEGGLFVANKNGFGTDGGQNYLKLGGVAEYFFSDLATVRGFGGVLVPVVDDPASSFGDIEEGYYAGGDLIYYSSHSTAFAGYVRYSELNLITINSGENQDAQTLHVGGKIRYLTWLSGVEAYAGAGYSRCEGGTGDFVIDGAEFVAGFQIHLGGQTGSLVAIDRSNRLDTRAWSCDPRVGG